MFSGEGVSRLREYLKRLAEDQEREGRISRDGSCSDAEVDSSRETISDDETIDAPEEMVERRRTLPRLADYRSYAEVVSGSGSNSRKEDETRAGDNEGVPLPQTRNIRMKGVFRRRSSGLVTFVERGHGPPSHDHLNGLYRREVFRRVSEGQGSSSRPRFLHSEVPTFDDYFPARLETQTRRPLPPRPHWLPQAQPAHFSEGEQQIFAPDWRDTSTVRASPQTSRATRSGSGIGHSVMGSREESTASAVYDTDDDGEMTLRQSSGGYVDMVDGMET